MNIASMDIESMLDRPFTWRTLAYGDIAVHVTGISTNDAVAVITIDGGEASTPAQRFPELSDGVYFALPSQLHKRTRPAKAAAKMSRSQSASIVSQLKAEGKTEVTF